MPHDQRREAASSKQPRDATSRSPAETHHAGVDDLSFARLRPLQQRQDDPQGAGEAAACEVRQQVQGSAGRLAAAAQPRQKAWGAKHHKSSCY